MTQWQANDTKASGTSRVWSKEKSSADLSEAQSAPSGSLVFGARSHGRLRKPCAATLLPRYGLVHVASGANPDGNETWLPAGAASVSDLIRWHRPGGGNATTPSLPQPRLAGAAQPSDPRAAPAGHAGQPAARRPPSAPHAPAEGRRCPWLFANGPRNPSARTPSPPNGQRDRAHGVSTSW